MQFFRPKRRQDAPAPQIAAEDGVGPGLLGEDLGGGKPDFKLQEHSRQELGQRRYPEVRRRTGGSYLTRRPRRAADCRRLRLCTAAPVY